MCTDSPIRYFLPTSGQMKDNLNCSCLFYMHSASTGSLLLVGCWASSNSRYVWGCSFSVELVLNYPVKNKVNKRRQTDLQASSVYDHVSFDCSVSLGLNKKKMGRWRQWLTIPMDIFLNFQNKIACFPFGHRDRQAEGRQQANFGETIGRSYRILL